MENQEIIIEKLDKIIEILSKNKSTVININEIQFKNEILKILQGNDSEIVNEKKPLSWILFKVKELNEVHPDDMCKRNGLHYSIVNQIKLNKLESFFEFSDKPNGSKIITLQ